MLPRTKSATRQQSRTRANSDRSLDYQGLESRNLLAGDVMAFLSGGQLVIQGDAAANQVTVRGLEGGGVEVEGTNGTRINGGAKFTVRRANMMPAGLTAHLGAGNDTLLVENFRTSGSMLIFGDRGADAIGLYRVQVRHDVLIDGGAGNDFVAVDESTISRNLFVISGGGSDTLGIDKSRVNRDTTIITGGGHDRLTVRDSAHRGPVFMATGAGNDFVAVEGTRISANARLRTGLGDDEVFTSTSQFVKRLNAHGNGGNDRLQVALSTNFGVTPVTRSFEGTQVGNVATRVGAIFDDLITSGARIGTIVEIARLNPNFSTLVGALQATGLDAALAAPGPFTVFAPLNSAFDKISGIVSGLTNDQLADVLKFHVASGALTAADVVSRTSIDTLLNKSFSVSVTGGNVVLNGNATLAATDIRAKNGIIHVLNDVLIPA